MDKKKMKLFGEGIAPDEKKNQIGFIVEDFSEGICTNDCKDIDYNYWNKYHELPQFMAFLAKK